MPPSPLVTVLLPTYNQEEFVGAAIESVLAQDYDNFRIVVSDDASQDRTADIVAGYVQRHPGKITLIRQPANLGVARNVVAMRPYYTGDYLCFFAGDDLFLPGKISRQVAAMEANPDAVLCYHDLEVFDSATGRTLYRFNEPGPGMAPLSGTNLVEDLLTRRCFIGGASVMVRRAALEDVVHRPEVERVCDWVYFMEAAHRGRIIYIPEVLVRYRRHARNLTSVTDIADEEMAYRFIEEHYPQYRRAAILGRTRLELSYAVRYALAGRLGAAMRLGTRVTGRLLRRPLALPFVLQSVVEMLRQRMHLLRRTGRIVR